MIQRYLHGCALNRMRHKSKEENVSLGHNFTLSVVVLLKIGSSAYVGKASLQVHHEDIGK